MEMRLFSTTRRTQAARIDVLSAIPKRQGTMNDFPVELLLFP
jgi:hypothetical protein